MTISPIVHTGGTIAVIDPDTGQVLALSDAPASLLARGVDHLDHVTRDAVSARATLADELGRRLGGARTLDAGSHHVEKNVRRTWDATATWRALAGLVEEGIITPPEVDEAMPEKTQRRPDGRKLNALLTRLVGEEPTLAQALALARDDRASIKVTATATDGTVAA